MTNEIGAECCPLCASEALQTLTRSREFSEAGVLFCVDGVEYAVCQECGGRTTTPAQTRKNKRRIIAAQKKAMGLLSGEQIREIREVRLHGLTQRQMAQLLGVGVNTFSRYETDAVPQSDAMNSLLVVLGEHPEVIGTLAQHHGVTLTERAPDTFSASWVKSFSHLQAVAANNLPKKINIVRTQGTVVPIRGPEFLLKAA